MKLTIALALYPDGSPDWASVVSAYSEGDHDAWNGTPGWFTHALGEQAKDEGVEIRTVTVSIDPQAIARLFAPAELLGIVEPVDPAEQDAATEVER